MTDKDVDDILRELRAEWRAERASALDTEDRYGVEDAQYGLGVTRGLKMAFDIVKAKSKSKVELSEEGD